MRGALVWLMTVGSISLITLILKDVRYEMKRWEEKRNARTH
jgi:hypothetical protein